MDYRTTAFPKGEPRTLSNSATKTTCHGREIMTYRILLPMIGMPKLKGYQAGTNTERQNKISGFVYQGHVNSEKPKQETEKHQEAVVDFSSQEIYIENIM